MKIIRIVRHFFFWNWFPRVQDLYNTFTSYIRVRELRGPIRGMTYEDIKKLFCLYILSWKNLSTKPTQRLWKWNSVTKCFLLFSYWCFAACYRFKTTTIKDNNNFYSQIYETRLRRSSISIVNMFSLCTL